MKFKRWCVTVVDNWTPTREFWTERGALKFRSQHSPCAYLYRWTGIGWVIWRGSR